MKVKETVTPNDIIELLNEEQDSIGMFKYLITQDDDFSSLVRGMCIEYYTIRSANKTVIPHYINILEMVGNSLDKTNEIFAKTIRSKFLTKWNKIYSALVSDEYDPLVDYELNTTKGGENTDTQTYGKIVDNIDKTNTNFRTTTTDEQDSARFGFNSTRAVPTNTDVNTNTVVEIGDLEDNKSEGKTTNSGSDKIVKKFGETENKKGRTRSPSELLSRELDVRNRYIFTEIVLKDVDSVLTLKIYE